MTESPKSAPKVDPKVSNGSAAKPKTDKAENDNIIRISRAHTPSFYIRASAQFLQGVVGKDGVEKKIFDEIVISALGAAIPIAAQVAGILEKNGVGAIVGVYTKYTELDFGKRPQICITVKRNPDYVVPESAKKGRGGAAKLQEPPTPERLKTDKMEKKMKKVLKEGGKRGVEIEGAADMGGVKYFSTKVLEPAGDLDLLVESVKAMNAKSDPSEEERKGGAGHVGKTVMSMEKDNDLCICSYVPPSEVGQLKAKDWLEAILMKLEVHKKGLSVREDSGDNYAQIHIQNNGETGVFCLKLRDYVIQNANVILTEKGLIPEAEDSDEDEMIFGDDDFDM